MYGKKIFFGVSLIGGILIVLIGLNLKLNETISGGFTFSKNGNIGYGIINCTSAIVLGFMILLFSLWTYHEYKKEKSDRVNRVNDEKKEKIKFIIRNSKRELNTYLFNRKEFNKKHNLNQ